MTLVGTHCSVGDLIFESIRKEKRGSSIVPFAFACEDVCLYM